MTEYNNKLLAGHINAIAIWRRLL